MCIVERQFTGTWNKEMQIDNLPSFHLINLYIMLCKRETFYEIRKCHLREVRANLWAYTWNEQQTSDQTLTVRQTAKKPTQWLLWLFTPDVGLASPPMLGLSLNPHVESVNSPEVFPYNQSTHPDVLLEVCQLTPTFLLKSLSTHPPCFALSLQTHTYIYAESLTTHPDVLA